MDYIKVDGSMGEGGGQILRSALSISAIINKPVEISRIRSGRADPGLRPQHLAAIKAMSEIFGAQVEGAQIDSEFIKFKPGEFVAQRLRIEIGTAGSIPLVLMTIIPAVALTGNKLSLEIIGGTDVPASPTIDYLRQIVLPAFRMIGIRFSLNIQSRGYYPKGGGVVRFEIEPCYESVQLELESTERPDPKVISVCSRLPSHVAQRQVSGALARLEKKGLSCRSYSASIETAESPGSSILVYCISESGVFIGGDSIGAPGKKAEIVGAEAANRFVDSHAPRAAQVDSHLADMLVVPLCFVKGKSRFGCAKQTSHLLTNLKLASLLTGCQYKVAGNDPIQVTITPESG